MNTSRYIKNKGTTQTIVKNKNGKPVFNDINWSLDYNGKEANVSLDINDNGNSSHVNTKLSNNDIQQLFNIPSVSMPLKERLQTDFPLNMDDVFMDEMNFKMPMSDPLISLMSIPEMIPIQEALEPAPALKPIKKSRRHKRHKKQKTVKNVKLYRTPLPKTMRIHLSSNSLAHGLKNKRHTKKGYKKSYKKTQGNLRRVNGLGDLTGLDVLKNVFNK